LQALDSVPVLGDVELLAGAVVSVRSLGNYMRDGASESRCHKLPKKKKKEPFFPLKKKGGKGKGRKIYNPLLLPGKDALCLNEGRGK